MNWIADIRTTIAGFPRPCRVVHFANNFIVDKRGAADRKLEQIEEDGLLLSKFISLCAVKRVQAKPKAVLQTEQCEEE